MSIFDNIRYCLGCFLYFMAIIAILAVILSGFVEPLYFIFK